MKHDATPHRRTPFLGAFLPILSEAPVPLCLLEHKRILSSLTWDLHLVLVRYPSRIIFPPLPWPRAHRG